MDSLASLENKKKDKGPERGDRNCEVRKRERNVIPAKAVAE
jgi:hypothetical protein